MYLDKLTINGFKSFADKIEFVFEQGITTVVGPNGCGKSNLSDAIRWALGEQSTKTLRCNRMSDLIFNGGMRANPLERAEVSLKFSGLNGELSMPHDSDELLIQRQLYQTGESRYYIDQQQCLLREINELFMGTGIGVSAYSVMEQSNIDLVLNTRPEERRFLFDEVAGITKYKYRKKKAIKKLEETEQNILRINDIILELKRQTDSLKLQAEMAQKYIQLKEKLKEFEFELSLRRYDELLVKIADTQSKFEEARKEIAEFEASIEEQDSQLNSVRSDQEGLSGEIDGSRAQIRTLENKIEQTESRIGLYRERQSNIKKSRQRAMENIDEMKKQLDEFDRQKQLRENEQQQLEATLIIDESRLDARQRVLNEFDKRILQSEQLIAEIEGQVGKVVEEFAELQGESSGLQNRLKFSTARLNSLLKDLDQMQLDVSAISRHLSESKEELDIFETKIVRSARETKATQESIKNKRDELRELESNVRQMQDKLERNSSRLRSLEQLSQSYEGYYGGVRSILLAKKNSPDRFAGIYGVIAEIIQTHPDYELAIEVALGSAIQNVVVETSEDAQEGISYLKQMRSGRATFLPLDIIQPSVYRDSFESESIFDQPSVLGLAYELLEYDHKYDNAIRHLLGNTVVVDKLDVAISLRRNRRFEARLVTLEGEQIGRSGAITGGYSKSMASGLLKRTREIDELKQTVSRLSKQMSELSAHRDKLRNELTAGREHLQKLSESSQSLRLEYAEKKKEFEQQEQQQIWLNEQIKSIEDEKAMIESERESAESDQLEVRAKLEELDREKQNLLRRIDRLKEEASIEMEKREEVRQSFTDLRIELAEKREKVQSFESAVKSIEANKLQVQDNIRRFESDIENDEQIREELVEKISQAQHEFLLLEQKKFDVSEEFDRLESEQSNLLKQIRSVEKELRSLRRRLGNSNKTEHSLEVELTRLDMQKKSIDERMLEKYDTPIDQIEQQNETALDDDKLSFEIENLNVQIDDMGKVNLMAIDEYEEHTKRLESMTAQKDDLEKSMDDIYKAIDKINEVTRKKFKESFEKIKVNFQDVFDRLFGGGEATLSLTDGDLLDAGVEITARPPGKKPKSISALSGGERTLVAIALLFAIFKLKASPFCVLDEVDAALDDANVIRFTRLLQDFATQTQFIIITHNKRTMEIADVIYGVTMEDAGISKIVSLKMSEGVKQAA